MFHREKMEGLKTQDRKGEVKRQRESVYRDVMSLRAWSSSSLMALYLSF